MQYDTPSTIAGGNSAKAPTVNPHSEAAASLGAEMEQRGAEARAQAEYHSHELRVWQAVGRACGAALEQLNRPTDELTQQSEGGVSF